MNELGPEFRISAEEFDRTFEELSNWGRWGQDDELGTLNFSAKPSRRSGQAGEKGPAGIAWAALGYRTRPRQ